MDQWTTGLMEDCGGQVYGLAREGGHPVDKFAQVQNFFGKICGEKRDLDFNHVF